MVTVARGKKRHKQQGPEWLNTEVQSSVNSVAALAMGCWLAAQYLFSVSGRSSQGQTVAIADLKSGTQAWSKVECSVSLRTAGTVRTLPAWAGAELSQCAVGCNSVETKPAVSPWEEQWSRAWSWGLNDTAKGWLIASCVPGHAFWWLSLSFFKVLHTAGALQVALEALFPPFFPELHCLLPAQGKFLLKHLLYAGRFLKHPQESQPFARNNIWKEIHCLRETKA